MSIESLQAQLAKIELKRKKLTERMDAERSKELLGLPAKLGLATIDELIMALAAHATPAVRVRIRAADPALTEQGRSQHPSQRRRRIPEQVKAQIKTELLRGNATVAALAEKYRTSPASIMKWKREWGLTRRATAAATNGSDNSA